MRNLEMTVIVMRFAGGAMHQRRPRCLVWCSHPVRQRCGWRTHQ
jgi:hypothetical protein